MSDIDLDEIEQRADKAAEYGDVKEQGSICTYDVPALVAAVREKDDEIARLQDLAEGRLIHFHHSEESRLHHFQRAEQLAATLRDIASTHLPCCAKIKRPRGSCDCSADKARAALKRAALGHDAARQAAEAAQQLAQEIARQRDGLAERLARAEQERDAARRASWWDRLWGRG